jgi:hypothetical protein
VPPSVSKRIKLNVHCKYFFTLTIYTQSSTKFGSAP